MKKFKFRYLGVFALSALALIGCTDNAEESKETYNTFYVTPTGDVTSDGLSKDAPTEFSVAFRNAKPGDTILLDGGTYKYNSRLQIENSGAANKYITIKPETAEDRVIFDFSQMFFNSANRGIQVYGSYWHFLDIEICGAGDNGMYIAGNYNIIENCQFYNNRDTGLQIGRGYSHQNTIDTWPSYNLIKNCTSFANYDDETKGENADGFAAKLTVGYGNVFDGCIAFRNSDDGWDLFAKEDSGNIGTVVLYNCVSFENGFLPYQIERSNVDGSTYMSYNTQDGDGIGFKLGGSTMEGDVLLENCLAFNNKLHGVGDNSNPGEIHISNSTAVNNCIGLEENGDVSGIRGITGEQNKSNNFDLARDTKSYNSYYGLVSYINNQTGYDISSGDSSYNEDHFRGSAAYSIFQTGYNGSEIYRAFTAYEDASSYHSSTTDVAFSNGTEYKGLSDDSFASLEPLNAKCEDAQHVADLTSYHKTLRNEDYSVNMGNTCKIVDEKLLKFANGNPIGANVSKSSMQDYKHYDLLDFSAAKTEDEVSVQAAYNALEVLCAEAAVYQDFEVSKLIQGCDIRWSSSDTAVLEVENEEKVSVSKSVFSTIRVHSPAQEKQVTLTATITKGNVEKIKTFNLTVKTRSQSLGQMVSTGLAVNRVELYQKFITPRIYPLDASSCTNTELPLSLYDMKYTYRYATDGNSKFNEIDNVYTSVAGVYEVTATATLKSNPEISTSYTYTVYVVDPNCEVDFMDSISSVTLNKDGFSVSGSLSNIDGAIYAVVSNEELNLTREELLAHPNVQKVEIDSNYITANFLADNNASQVYYGYYLVSNRNKSNVNAKVYSFHTDIITIDTKEEFKNLASTGKKGTETATSTTIYSLSNDLDFTDFEWEIPTKAQAKAFTGLFNGNGHTISNIKVIGASADKTVNIFFKLSNATLMNIHFDHITIENKDYTSGKQVGIIGEFQGGYLHNIHMTNVSVKGNEGVGALVGQVTGGVNYISQCSLVNPVTEQAVDNPYVIASAKKYAGGIVGNGQKNSDQSVFKLIVTDCMVNAIIGDGNDSGGNTGGIIGRVKNDSNVYYTQVENCYFKGIVVGKGNYNAGIVGDFDGGLGHVVINCNYSDVSFVFAGVYLNAKELHEQGTTQLYAHKNTNPIVGRAVWAEGGIYETRSNVGTFVEYYSNYIQSFSIEFELAQLNEETYKYEWTLTELFLSRDLGFDLENIWVFDEATQDLKLR